MALEVFTYDALPAKWADTQDNLGGAYVQRIAGDRQAKSRAGHFLL